jgi:hypothetical protein
VLILVRKFLPPLLLAAFSIAAIYGLLYSGLVYSAVWIQLWEAAAGATVIAAVLWALRASGNFNKVVATVSVVAAVPTIALIFGPTRLSLAATPACRNTQTVGTNYLATTRDYTKVYAGPGRNFSVVQGLDAHCSVGFDHYCIGQFVADPLINGGLPDSRWLILPQHFGSSARYVAAQDVIAQEESYGAPPSSSGYYCSPLPGPPVPSYTQDGSGALHFKFDLQPAELVPALTGLAIARRARAQDRFDWIPLGLTSTYAVRFDDFWAVDHNFLRTEETAYIAMASCYAVGAPTGGVYVYELDAKTMDLKPVVVGQVPDDLDMQLLERTACIPRPA